MWTGILIGGGLGTAIGAVLGYVGKCRSGACPLTGNPYGGAMFGALIGVMLAISLQSGYSTDKPAEGGKPLPVVKSAEQFRSEVLGADGPVVVKFFATWCGACKQLAPTIRQLAAEYEGRVSFVELDVDEVGEIAQQYGVDAIPAVKVFVGGEVVHSWVGVHGGDEYRRVLDSILAAHDKGQRDG